MKSSLIAIALLFTSFILNGQTITDLNLSETEYARIDSFIKEIVYRHEAGEFKHLSDNEIRKFITNELRLFIPANKLSQFEQMVLAEEQVRSREVRNDSCTSGMDEAYETSIILKEDSLTFQPLFLKLKEYLVWWEKTIAPEYDSLQSYYLNVLPARFSNKLDMIRQLDIALINHYYSIPNPQTSTTKPYLYRSANLTKMQLLKYPDVNLTIDRPDYGQPVHFAGYSDFVKMREEIVAALNVEDRKALAISLRELELKCKKYLDTEAPELLAEWKPKKAQSVADQNLLLNFLLRLRGR